MRKKVWIGSSLILASIFLIAVEVWLYRNNIDEDVGGKNMFSADSRYIVKKQAFSEVSSEVGDSIEILNLPTKINSWDLVEKDWKWFFKVEELNQQLLYNGHDVRVAGLSPSHKKLGFFYSPEDHALGETVLVVFDIGKRVAKELYRGDTRVSNWEWKGDEAVIVKRSCGTSCMFAYVIDVDTLKQIDSYRVY